MFLQALGNPATDPQPQVKPKKTTVTDNTPPALLSSPPPPTAAAAAPRAKPKSLVSATLHPKKLNLGIFSRELPSSFLTIMEDFAFQQVVNTLAKVVNERSSNVTAAFQEKMNKCCYWVPEKQVKKLKVFMEKQPFIDWLYDGTYRAFCRENCNDLHLYFPETIDLPPFLDLFYSFVAKLPVERDITSLKWLNFSHEQWISMSARILREAMMAIFLAKTLPDIKTFHQRWREKQKKKKKHRKQVSPQGEQGIVKINYVDDSQLPVFDEDEDEKNWENGSTNDFDDNDSIFSATDLHRKSKEFLDSVKKIKRGLAKLEKHGLLHKTKKASSSSSSPASSSVTNKKKEKDKTKPQKKEEEDEEEDKEPHRKPTAIDRNKTQERQEKEGAEEEEKEAKKEKEEEEVVVAQKENLKVARNEKVTKVEEKEKEEQAGNEGEEKPKLTKEQMQFMMDMFKEKQLPLPETMPKLQTAKSRVIEVGDETITIYGDPNDESR